MGGHWSLHCSVGGYLVMIISYQRLGSLLNIFHKAQTSCKSPCAIPSARKHLHPPEYLDLFTPFICSSYRLSYPTRLQRCGFITLCLCRGYRPRRWMDCSEMELADRHRNSCRSIGGQSTHDLSDCLFSFERGATRYSIVIVMLETKG